LTLVVRNIACFLEQLVPAYFADCVLRIVNRRPIFVKIQKKLQKALHVLETFTRMHLEFSTDNYLMLLNEMSSNDSQDFKFDTRNLEWEKYTENYFLGIKKFLLKEDMSKLDNYRAKLKLMRNIIRSIFYLAMVAFFLSRFPAFKEYMKTFVRLVLLRRNLMSVKTQKFLSLNYKVLILV
ncbi:fatty acyl- reductase 2, partial [Brachionus plicatilis]